MNNQLSPARRFCECAWNEHRPTARAAAWSSSVMAAEQARHIIVSWALALGVKWDDDESKTALNESLGIAKEKGGWDTLAARSVDLRTLRAAPKAVSA